jgi:hypothetical protein
MNPTPVAIYARVSSEQPAEAQTIASQVAALRERVAAEDFLPFVNVKFVTSARPAHNESGWHHSTYDDAAWPSGYAGVGRQYCVKPGHGAVPLLATSYTRC